jgi:hypothetical protein
MLVSALLIGFIILGLFMSMLSSRPKSDHEPGVPVLLHQREISPLPDAGLQESPSSDLLLSRS